MLWLDSLMPRKQPEQPLMVHCAPAFWIAAALFALAYVFILGPGIKLSH